MARSLAFLQFLIIGVGAFTLHLLVKVDSDIKSAAAIETLTLFLARHALWLFPIPILWAIFATVMQGRMSKTGLHGIGIVLTVLVFLLLAVPLYFCLV